MKKFMIAVAIVALAAFATPVLAATNPFMDVPASHWAYDAVAQLAARGVISGYPDGSYKGGQPTTRYEMASALARALAHVDMTKASKQDVEMLKKLIVEFKDELDALGVKVDKIDSRLAVLERDLGGWSLSGQFRFDANFGTDDHGTWYGDDMRQRGQNDFDLNRYRIFLRKRINETTSFTARIGSQGANRNSDGNVGHPDMRWERYFIETKLPYDITLVAGRNYVEWETDLGFVGDNDPVANVHTANMLWFKKDWGMANLQLIFGRLNDDAGLPDGITGSYSHDAAYDAANGLEKFFIAGLANFNISERFRAGVMGYYYLADNEARFGDGRETDSDILTVGAYLGFAFTPSIELKGIYYYQDLGDTYAWISNNMQEDSPSAWRVILDVDQEALKFTSAWIEYGQIDNNFQRMTETNPYTGLGADLLFNQPRNTNTTKVYGANLQQQWNDKWRTFARYYFADYDTVNLDDATNWTLGVAYRLNPAVEFELAYDQIDYGNDRGNTGAGTNARIDDDHIIRLRTFVTF